MIVLGLNPERLFNWGVLVRQNHGEDLPGFGLVRRNCGGDLPAFRSAA